MFDQFHDVKEKADKGNAHAKAVLQSWADAEWFTSRPEVPETLITVTSSRSPARPTPTTCRPHPTPGAAPDIPLHALAMLKNPRPGIVPEEDGKRGPVQVHRGAAGEAATWSPMSATWSAPARAASRRPTRCCGSPARTFPFVPEQALRRRLPGRQDRADLLQHDGRRRRAADRARRQRDGHGRRRRAAPLRRQGR